MKIALALAVALVCTIAAAAEPVAKITGKNVAKTGDLIVLSSAESTPETKRKWTVWPELIGSQAEVNENLERWAAALREHGATVVMPAQPDDSSSIAIEGDGRLILASYPGVYRVMLAVANSEGIGVAKWTVTVTRHVAPDPGPDPDPDPDPKPDDPDPPPTPPGVTPRYELTVACKNWLVQIPNETLSERPAMRQIFATIGRGAADGRYATVKEVESGLAATITDADKNKLLTKAAWNSWGKSASGAIVALQQAGEIKTPQDYGQALLEIAEGLK